MFKIDLYGVADKGLGIIRSERTNSIELEKINMDDISFVIVEDSKTHMKRYIFSVIYRSKIMKNNIDGFYKSVMLFGKENLKSWAQIINYSDAEIFYGSPVHILQMLEIIIEASKNQIPFWKINNLVKEYGERYNVECYTKIEVE